MVGVACAVSGEEVLLVVVPRVGAGVEFDPADLYRRLEQRLARHMRPAFIDVRSSLPRTPSGKIDRHTLKAGIESRLNWVSPSANVRD